jgi:cholesterol transport system auxiliary component
MTHVMICRRRTLKNILPIGISAFGTSACSNLLGPPDARTIYRVRPSFSRAPVSETAGPTVLWALAIARPHVSGGLDTDRIALIQANGTMDYYANAIYPDRLPGILQSVLLEGFEVSGRIHAVAREDDALHSDYGLVTEVRDFQAQYGVAGGIPEATVTIAAKLIASRDRRILGSFTASQTVSASANSIAAATQALRFALTSTVAAIVDWTLAEPMSRLVPQ